MQQLGMWLFAAFCMLMINLAYVDPEWREFWGTFGYFLEFTRPILIFGTPAVLLYALWRDIKARRK